MPGQFSALLTHTALIAKDILEFWVKKPANFSFLPGQFVQFLIPGAEGSVARSYSIVSLPDQSELRFCLKILPDGKASAFFAMIAPGTAVSFTAAAGRFVCEDHHSPRKYFVATGTGIAPIMAMLGGRLAKPAIDERLELLFGVRSEGDLFWTNEINAWGQTAPLFKHQLVLSQPERPEQWDGLHGRVTEHLTIDPAGDYYICGSVEMVKDVRTKLVAGGVPMKQIHFEIF